MESSRIDRWAKFFGPRCTQSSNSDCLIWGRYSDGLGYGRASAIEGEIKAHRISWTLWNGPIPKDKCVLHQCDVRNCVHPGHLFLGTQAENVADMMRKGRHRAIPLYGAHNPQAKMDAHTAIAIKNAAAEPGVTQVSVANHFNVSEMTVSRIVRGKLWTRAIEEVEHAAK